MIETILACYPVVAELRPHLSESHFIQQAQLQFKEGYQLWGLIAENEVAGIIGFRIENYLAWGKIFYIDDFATLSTQCRKGYADHLMKWAIKQANEVYQCDEIHLDTGYSRHKAHKLYLKNGFNFSSHHLRLQCSGS